MTREDYIEKYALPQVINDMNEIRETRYRSIIFPNGCVASIIPCVYNSKKMSIAVSDYNGYFNWDVLNKYGAVNGTFICSTEEEIQRACDVIRNLSSIDDNDINL